MRFWFKKSANKLLNEEWNELHKEFIDIISSPLGNMDISELQEHKKRIDKLEEDMRNINKRKLYISSGNRYNLCLWGYWWFMLTLNISACIIEFSRYRALSIIISIFSLILWYKIIMKNKKIRDDLFLEGI